MKRFLLISLVLLITGSLWAIIKPREIKCAGNYVQPETMVSFPETFVQFKRVDIYSFNNQQTNIGVTYRSTNGLLITVYIYPAGKGTEDRLRWEFLDCLQQISAVSMHKLHPTMELTSYSDSGYKINGLKAEVDQTGNHTFLMLYECGEWFFKTRITVSGFGSKESIKQAEQELLKQFNPTDLVRKAPLKPRANISLSRGAIKDSLMLDCQVGSALSKSKWAMEHVDSLERAAGFPGIYFDMQVEGLKKILEFASEHPAMSRSTSTDEYLKELNLINNSGYLNDFIRDQFIVPMIGDRGTEANVEGYEKWKKQHPLQLNIGIKYYKIYYDIQTKRKSLADTVDVLYADKVDSCVNAGVDSLQSNNYLIVTKIDEGNEDYIQMLCTRLNDRLTGIGNRVRMLYTTYSNESVWAAIPQKSKATTVLLLIPDNKYTRNTTSFIGQPSVSLKRDYTVKIFNRTTHTSVSKKISISYKDDQIEHDVEKAYDKINKIQLEFNGEK